MCYDTTCMLSYSYKLWNVCRWWIVKRNPLNYPTVYRYKSESPSSRMQCISKSSSVSIWKQVSSTPKTSNILVFTETNIITHHPCSWHTLSFQMKAKTVYKHEIKQKLKCINLIGISLSKYLLATVDYDSGQNFYFKFFLRNFFHIILCFQSKIRNS